MTVKGNEAGASELTGFFAATGYFFRKFR
jgi:hypothetical protein